MKRTIKCFLLILTIGFCHLALYAQNKKIDSLLTLINSDKADTNMVIHLNKLSLEYVNIGSYDTALLYANQVLALCTNPDKFPKSQTFTIQKGIASAYNNLGVAYHKQGDYSKALDYFLKALTLDEQLKEKKAIAKLLGSIGSVYLNQGNYSKTLDYYFKAFNMAEELGDKQSQAKILSNIGIVFYVQKEYIKALEYDFKGLKMAEELGYKKLKANTLSNIGLVYEGQKDYKKGLDYYLKALKLAEELGLKNAIASDLGNIGGAYYYLGDYPKALDYSFKTLKMAEGLGDKQLQSNTIGTIGMLYTKTGKFKEAEQYIKRAISMDNNSGAMNELINDYEILSQLYDTTGRQKLALIQYKKSVELKDTLFSQENKKQLVRKEMNYEFDKKEAITKSENDKQQAVAEEKSRKQKFVIWSVAFGLLLVLVFTGFIFRSLRITRKQKNIIELQKNEVSQQKEIVEKQKHIVEEKQKEIVDSITYARRIQRALLTSDEYIKNNLQAEYFILFKPKDIVSGDFYWALRTPSTTAETGKGLFYIATADCTGHGVPGAFMSMLNISYLNENVIERGIRMPHDILNAQRTEIIKALNPQGSAEVSRDGMDCILCVYDFDKMLLHFASANNPLWLVRNGELVEYKADKMPVGKYMDETRPFNLQTIELQKGDVIYTSTDGYADQFGANGKKLMKQKFKEELLKIHHQSMNEQKEYLSQFFENWKGNTEQVDDVCVIGVRI